MSTGEKVLIVAGIVVFVLALAATIFAFLSAKDRPNVNLDDLVPDGLQPVEMVVALPTDGNFEGRVVFLTADQKLYRWQGGFFSALECPVIEARILP